MESMSCWTAYHFWFSKHMYMHVSEERKTRPGHQLELMLYVTFSTLALMVW